MAEAVLILMIVFFSWTLGYKIGSIGNDDIKQPKQK
jgi:hypothetical protein